MNDPMTERLYRKRLDDFDSPIGELARNNPAVYRIIEEYARGRIITKEEALSQMVVLLARNWEEATKRYYEDYMRAQQFVLQDPSPMIKGFVKAQNP